MHTGAPIQDNDRFCGPTDAWYDEACIVRGIASGVLTVGSNGNDPTNASYDRSVTFLTVRKLRCNAQCCNLTPEHDASPVVHVLSGAL